MTGATLLRPPECLVIRPRRSATAMARLARLDAALRLRLAGRAFSGVRSSSARVQKPVASAAMLPAKSAAAADLLTSHAFGLLMGVSAETVIKQADAAAAGRKPRRAAPPLPTPIVTGMGSYRWRPAHVVPYLIEAGYKVPEELVVRAKRDGWVPARPEPARPEAGPARPEAGKL